MLQGGAVDTVEETRYLGIGAVKVREFDREAEIYVGGVEDRHDFASELYAERVKVQDRNNSRRTVRSCGGQGHENRRLRHVANEARTHRGLDVRLFAHGGCV